MAESAGAVSRETRREGQKMFPEERRALVLDLLARQPKVLVSELAERFGVSTFTVRSDLDELENEGKLRRCHGGAMSIAKATAVENYSKRLSLVSEAKRSIGAAAAGLVEDGDSIIVDTGTTTIEIVRNLTGVRGLTIVTNDFEVSSLAEQALPDATVLFLGGFVRSGYRYTYGNAVLAGIEPLHVDKAFISANGFTVEDGFTSESLEQAQIKAAYARAATECIAVIDTGKLGVVSFSGFLATDAVDAIVTEKPLDRRIRDRIVAANSDVEFISAS